jgi:hypothetical protein
MLTSLLSLLSLTMQQELRAVSGLVYSLVLLWGLTPQPPLP